MSVLDDRFPKDPAILLSFINTKLRDQYDGDLDQLCEDMDIGRADLIDELAKAGFEYSPEANKFW